MNPLLEKYNVPAPRYTSYPVVPCWNELPPSGETWMEQVRKTFSATNQTMGISLYIHLPFCESLCTYCGCNTRITVNHGVELPYLTAVLSEWRMYVAALPEVPRISEIHLGGGTPTFFSPAHLGQLVRGILSSAIVCPDAAFSFEGHPANTTPEHLEVLRACGFTRISLGIQDFDPAVQRAIHRFQTVGDVEKITSKARDTGFTSVNYDLIYGLPRQTEESIAATIRETIRLRPDRIAFYSYAHVPWMKPGQRSFTEADLPDAALKQKLRAAGREAFLAAGYLETGMDHFALADDDLSVAAKAGRLHRNFMGYTSRRTDLLIGLGVSSISDAWTGFVQNEKTPEAYYHRILHNELPFFKGHVLSEEDLVIRRHILSVMCAYGTEWDASGIPCEGFPLILERLGKLADDGLILLRPGGLEVTVEGREFLRTICMAFDLRLHARQAAGPMFSQSV